jgi:hypothetical protein
MRRFVCVCLGLLFGCALAPGQRLVFTTRTHPACPVLISAPSESKDFGFHAIRVRNDSKQPIVALQLRVTIPRGQAQDEVVDGKHVLITLAPGEVKRLEVHLGSVQGCRQKARNLQQEITSVMLFVESAEFSDGTQWNGDEPVLGLPVKN